ncbi:MAG: nucleotidyltransferase substrate binding protein [Nitrosomonas sp.]|uniref:nucleotidyltransferase substrate binding protein n=1 Tax=Nitrosomonas sp. TaxID=42353 RepID=UPI0025CEBE5A|nr:nucleotidyltransferase substrate binding protein [Nitrosomonas sp.]UJP02377.1 MAG: nucleotidyltransferase substrate binding protein [Nitrosomonas sp.]
MSSLNTDYFVRCIATLNRAFDGLNQQPQDSDMYDIYRAACIKEFEIILEQTGKLLKKCLKPYFASNKQVDQLLFKDIFRQAAKHGLISLDEAERWLVYRDNRNDTAHDYGEGFANETLRLLPQFIQDARRISEVFRQQ